MKKNKPIRFPKINSKAPPGWTLVPPVGDDQTAIGGNTSIVISGKHGKSVAGLGSVAATNESGCASCSGVAAVALDGGCATVGDGSVAWAGPYGYASGEGGSMAYAPLGGYALIKQHGVAMSSAGLAEVAAPEPGASAKPGLAVTYNYPIIGLNGIPIAFVPGIAVAPPGGVAVGMEEGSILSAGEGGLLVGFNYDPKSGMKVVSHHVKKTDAGKLFVLTAGKFKKLGEADEKAVNRQIAQLRLRKCPDKCGQPPTKSRKRAKPRSKAKKSK